MVWLVMGDDVSDVFMIRVGRNCAEGVVTDLRRGVVVLLVVFVACCLLLLLCVVCCCLLLLLLLLLDQVSHIEQTVQ